MLPLILQFLIAFYLVYLVLTKHKKKEPFHPPPGPKGLPLIGNFLQFDANKPHIYMSELAKIYGPLLSLRIGCRQMVVVQSAKAAKEVLKTQDLNFCTRPHMVASRKLSYNRSDMGFAPYGDYYREVRKIIVVHLLSTKRVQSFSTIRQDEVLRLIQKIDSLASSSQIINLSELSMSFANSNICRVAFGKRYESNEGLSTRSKFHTILNETQAMFIDFFFTDYFPLMGWLDKLIGQYSKLERVFKQMDNFLDQVIVDHLDPNKPKSDQENVIDVLLYLRKERSFSFDLTINHIKALIMDIFVAGSDTSAAMIVWAMIELLLNPDIMKKVQDEIRTNIQEKDQKHVTMDDLPKLKYLNAVVKESFRLHPAAPLLIVREAIQKCNIEGYDILPKTLVHINVWAIGRNPKSWKDPEKFIPERFFESSVDYKGQDFEFIPFGAGRRICPGMHLGVASFELALANLLYSFDWELPIGMKKGDIDFEVLPGIAMHKKNPLCLVARKYRGL